MSSIPDFSELALGGASPAATEDQWRAAVKESTGTATGDLLWETPEGIGVKPLYTGRDLEGLDFLATYPGRGPVPARPVPDDVRQPALDDPAVRRLLHGGGVERFYRRNLASGQKGLSVAFDLRRTAVTTATTRA